VSGQDRDALHELAHALRTPIAVIQGFAELLLRDDGTLTPQQRHDYAERIRTAAGDLRDELDRRLEAAARPDGT
jgi:signal transduction histidine kinase